MSGEPEASVGRLPLHGRHGRGRFALVDADQLAELAQHRWRFHHKRDRADRSPEGYVVRERQPQDPPGGCYVRLHHTVLGQRPLPPGSVVDHINRDPLDNRRANLRVVSVAQNNVNRRVTQQASSRYRGVTRVGVRFKAVVKLGGEELDLGLFESERDAARIRDLLALLVQGEVAQTNFPARRYRARVALLRRLLRD